MAKILRVRVPSRPLKKVLDKVRILWYCVAMKIKKFLSQNRRDFRAIFECEHCGHDQEAGGYDDAYFHAKVIPAMVCEKCGKIADNDYRPLTTKYAEGEDV